MSEEVLSHLVAGSSIQYGTDSGPDFNTWPIFDIVVVESAIKNIQLPYELPKVSRLLTDRIHCI